MSGTKKLRIGDTIGHDYLWAQNRDVGDGVVEAIGADWVLLRETFYDSLVKFDGHPNELAHLVGQVDSTDIDDEDAAA